MSINRTAIAAALVLAGAAFVILFVVLGVTLWVSLVVAAVLLVGGVSLPHLGSKPSAGQHRPPIGAQ